MPEWISSALELGATVVCDLPTPCFLYLSICVWQASEMLRFSTSLWISRVILFRILIREADSGKSSHLIIVRPKL
jgi:hypothetical protein